jgi:hypothetical protein
MNTLSYAGGVLFAFGFGPYILAIFGRNVWGRQTEPTKPAQFTWIVWASLNTVILYTLDKNQAINGLILSQFGLAWIVAGLSLVRGSRTWTVVDVVCAVLFAVAYVSYTLANYYQPEIAHFDTSVVLALAMLCASWSMFFTAWENPESESLFGWVIYCVAGILTVAGMPSWDTKVSAQPIMFLVIATITVCILVGRTWKIVRR